MLNNPSAINRGEGGVPHPNRPPWIFLALEAWGWGEERGGPQSTSSKTQAKRACFELVHCLAPKRPGSPALTGFPEPQARIGLKKYSGVELGGWGGGEGFRGSARGRNAPSPLFKAEGLLSKE